MCSNMRLVDVFPESGSIFQLVWKNLFLFLHSGSTGPPRLTLARMALVWQVSHTF